MEIKKNRVIEINDLVSAFFNADFDGDSMFNSSIHSKQAKQDFSYMFIKNINEFDQTDKLLIDYEHVSIFAAYMLSKKAYESKELILENNFNNEDYEELKNIDEVNFNTKADIQSLFNTYINLNKSFKRGGIPLLKEDGEPNKIYSLFEILVNLALGINIQNGLLYTFEDYGILSKKNLNKLTYDFYKYLQDQKLPNEFWDRIHIFNKFLLEAGSRLSYAIASFDFKDFQVKNENILEYKETLIQNEPFLAFHQNLVLFDEFVMPEVEKNEDGILNTLFKSGARLKSVQLLKAASNTGIPTDIYGKAMPINIKNALLDGLTKEDYFNSGDSARLALGQRQDAIPKGGELQRKFFFVTGILKQNKEINDCFEHTGKEKYFEIQILNEKFLKVLKYRWYKIPGENEEKLLQGDEEHLIGQTVLLRTPITCQLEGYQICKKCLGEKRPSTANLGAPIGQYLSEAIIQSVLRAHHFGGVFLAQEDNKIKNILKNSIIQPTEDKTTIISSKENIDYIKEYLESKYEPQDIELNIEDLDDKSKIEIEVHNLPFSEDAVKILTNITGLIDKNISKKNEISIINTFNKLIEISAENGIFNIYFELVLSLLFYNEDDVLFRYTDKPIVKQLALKDIINNIDPKLSIFYNFGNKTVQKIFTTKKDDRVDHMYRDLINIYK